jgi:hypothetical protein
MKRPHHHPAGEAETHQERDVAKNADFIAGLVQQTQIDSRQILDQISAQKVIGTSLREQEVGKVLLEYMRLRHERGEIDVQTEDALIAKFPEEDRKHGRELLLTAELLMIVDPEKLDDEDQ